jgi:hypothetical protein
VRLKGSALRRACRTPDNEGVVDLSSLTSWRRVIRLRKRETVAVQEVKLAHRLAILGVDAR